MDNRDCAGVQGQQCDKPADTEYAGKYYCQDCYEVVTDIDREQAEARRQLKAEDAQYDRYRPDPRD